MPILKDTTIGETFRIHICYKCDADKYPTGKPIDITDKYACKEKDGSCTCGECVFEELNRSKLRVLGPDHKDVKAFIQKEDDDCKKWNNYVKRVNQNMGTGLKYQKNRTLVWRHFS
jgi:hypothetical protein